MTYWWSETDPPSRTSPTGQMIVEVQKMKQLFNSKKPTLFESTVEWDRPFAVVTHELVLDTTDPRVPKWTVVFHMEQPRPERHHRDAQHTMEIRYDADHPDSEPAVHIVRPQLGSSEHMFMGGRLCLYDHRQSRSRGWDPAKSTAATFGLWSVWWLRAHYYWKVHDLWPNATGY